MIQETYMHNDKQNSEFAGLSYYNDTTTYYINKQRSNGHQHWHYKRMQLNAQCTVGHNMYADTEDCMPRDNNAKTVSEVTNKKPKTQESRLSR
jgi:hypothetical protein